MPRTIFCETDAVMRLDECVEAVAVHGFDPREDVSLLHAASCLRRLGNNTTFLGDILLDELKARHRKTGNDSSYTAQSVILSEPRGDFFLRANIWPSRQDQCYRASGAHSFAYGGAHDHNFDFLTLGYFGPGYVSDYYEYDCRQVTGYVGEQVELRFAGRSTLDPGKMLLYRACRDVHIQHPPGSLSVSLNIMATNSALAWQDQYAFDVKRGVISGLLNPGSTETFLRLAVGLRDQNALDMAREFGRYHPCHRIRLASFEARSLLADNAQDRDRLWSEAEGSGSALLSREARKRRAGAL